MFHYDCQTSAVVLERGVTAIDASTTVNVDGSTATSTQAFSASCVYGCTTSTTFWSAGGTVITLAHNGGLARYGSTVGLGTAIGPGDVYNQQIRVPPSDFGGIQEDTTIQNWTAIIADQTFTHPAPLGLVATTILPEAPLHFETSWSAHPDALGYRWEARQGEVIWRATLSAGYAGGAPQFVLPDLSALPGWTAALELQFASMTGGVTAVTSTAGAVDFPTVDPAPAGTQRAFITRPFAL
jgi:hypothetical protein